MAEPTKAATTPPTGSESTAFERWRRRAALLTGVGGTEEDRLRDIQEFQSQTCDKWKTHLMHYSPWPAPVLLVVASSLRNLYTSCGARSVGGVHAEASQAVWMCSTTG